MFYKNPFALALCFRFGGSQSTIPFITFTLYIRNHEYVGPGPYKNRQMTKRENLPQIGTKVTIPTTTSWIVFNPSACIALNLLVWGHSLNSVAAAYFSFISLSSAYRLFHMRFHEYKIADAHKSVVGRAARPPFPTFVNMS